MGRTKEKLVSCVRSLLAFLFSQVGLCALVVGYAVLGAIIFESLEADNEIHQRKEIQRFRDHCLANVRNLTEKLEDNFTWVNWTSEVGSLLKDFEDQVVRAVKLDGYDGKETNDEERQWSFSGALLYSVTVITTIGYGNLAPKTPEGKIVTMLYALLGIPLMLLCLSNIGTLMASTLQFAFGKICCDCNYHRHHDYEDPTPPHHEFSIPTAQSTSPVRKSHRNSIKVRTKPPSVHEDFSDFEYDHIWESSTSLANQMVQKEVVELYILDRLGWEAKSVLAECAEYALEHDESMDNQCYESTARLIDNIKGSTSVLVPQEQLSKQYQESSCPSDDAEAETSEPDMYRLPITTFHTSQRKQQESNSISVSETETPLGTWLDDAASESSVSTWNSRHWLHKDSSSSKSFRNRFKRKMSLPAGGSRRFKSFSKRTCNKSQQTDACFGTWMASAGVMSAQGSDTTYQNNSTSALPTLLPRGSSKQPTIMEGLYFAYHDPYLRQYLLKPPTPPPPPVKDIDVVPKDATPQVPVPVVLFLVVGYICVGALVFSAWEEWSFLDGAYFSFITLSTIGFGDLVPGHRVLSAATREGQTKLVICCLYLVIGLAIIAMSFSLVQNEVVSRCKKIGKELGIIR